MASTGSRRASPINMSKFRSNGCLNSESASTILSVPSAFMPVIYSTETVWPSIFEKIVDILPPRIIDT